VMRALLLWLPLLVVAAMLAEPPVVVLLEVSVEPLVEVVPALFVESLLATVELLVDGVELAVELLAEGVEAVADEVSLAATEAFVEAVDVLLVADGEELLISELLVLLLSVLATEELLVDGVVLLVLLARPLLVLAVEDVASLDGDELLAVLAWLLGLLLAKPVEEEVEAVDDGEEPEVVEELVLAGCSLLAKPEDVLAVEVEAVADGAEADELLV
jgi:hypothetical protein